MNQWSKNTISLVIPYKIERGKASFQCGAKEFKPKARQGKAIKPKSLFLLLFMSLTAFFSTIYCTILTNFYIYL